MFVPLCVTCFLVGVSSSMFPSLFVCVRANVCERVYLFKFVFLLACVGVCVFVCFRLNVCVFVSSYVCFLCVFERVRVGKCIFVSMFVCV